MGPKRPVQHVHNKRIFRRNPTWLPPPAPGLRPHLADQLAVVGAVRLALAARVDPVARQVLQGGMGWRSVRVHLLGLGRAFKGRIWTENVYAVAVTGQASRQEAT